MTGVKLWYGHGEIQGGRRAEVLYCSGGWTSVVKVGGRF